MLTDSICIHASILCSLDALVGIFGPSYTGDLLESLHWVSRHPNVHDTLNAYLQATV